MKLIRHFIRSVTIYRWNGYKAPAQTLRPSVAIDSIYLPKGFGNTEIIEDDEGTCLRYTQLDMPHSSKYARARTYNDTTAEIAECFINPLSRNQRSIEILISALGSSITVSARATTGDTALD